MPDAGFRVQIAHLGPAGTHSQAAAQARFAPPPTARVPPISMLPAASFPDIFAKLRTEEAHYGVLPVQNSTSGIVHTSLDALIATAVAEPGIRVLGEHYFSVHHCLLSNSAVGGQLSNASPESLDTTSLAGIRRVYSHNEALAQCRTFLSSKLPQAELVRVESTAKAAEIASKEDGAAAIAPDICSDIYGIPVVARNIEDASDNTTRFLIVSMSYAPSPRPLYSPRPAPAGPDASLPYNKSLLLALPRAGRDQAFTEILSSFASHKIPVLNVWTRPYKPPAGASSEELPARARFRSYVIVEFASYGALDVGKVTDYVTKELESKGVCEMLKVLGSWIDEGA
ncbi:Prephenate dehydratase-domain-containing protein [Hyaloraphidium curvatum]|nr:Prephenate dehydratase-domain-containing protein [Hyaloraphidium curvatum]